jgi:hypothetical protein
MRQFWWGLVLIVLSLQQAFAWGPEGHSIVAEIAQREMQPSTRSMIDALLNHATLASVSNWADDVKFTTRPETYPWHFVDIPLNHDTFSPADCRDKQRPQYGDVCLITALDSIKTALSCGTDEATKRENLRLVVHLIGDSTQPLHTVDDFTGGNGLMVNVGFCGLKNTNCHPPTSLRSVKFHELWDRGLITETVWSWGSYVDRLYDRDAGWMNSAAARQPDPAGDASIAWINDTHSVAQKVWTQLLPANRVIDQPYYDAAVPILDRQLGIGGLRLARYLDAVFARKACPSR